MPARGHHRWPLAFDAAESMPWKRLRAARADNSANAWRDFADTLAAHNRPRGAIIAFTRAIRRDPIDVRARHAAAELAWFELDDTARAKARLYEVVAINPHDRDAHARLGRILMEESMAHAVPAEGHLRRAHHLGIGPREALVSLCRLLANQSRDREIVQLTAGYTDAAVLDQRMHAQAALGELDAAADTAASALERNPHAPVAWHHLGALRRPDRAPAVAVREHGGDPIAAVRDKVHRAQPGTELREAFAFALANMLESAGAHDEAWSWYVEGNTTIRERIDTDIAEMEALEERTIRAFPAATVARLSRAGIRTSGAVPAFIVGLPRSGTTLVERILAAHSDAAPLGERADFVEARDHAPVYGGGRELPWPERAAYVSPITTGAIAGSYVKRINSLVPAGTKLALDKHLGNTRQLGLIAAALPQARIIHVRRDSRDVMASCYTARFHQGLAWSFDLDDIARRQASHERLMRHWRATLPGGRMLEIAYEDLVQEPERVAREMLAFCGLDWEPGCIGAHAATDAPVRTSSVRQVRAAISPRSIGRWRRFPHLRARFDDGGSATRTSSTTGPPRG